MKVKACAKINLRLEIVGRRDDGYHLLHSIMAPVSLADELTFTPNDTDQITLSCNDPAVPLGEANLVMRAVHSLLALADRQLGLHIDLHKRIPVAAGLGGGSSDAAASLLAIRAMINTKITDILQ